MSTGIGAAKSSDICSVGLNTSALRSRRFLLLRVAGCCLLGLAASLLCSSVAGTSGVSSLAGYAATVISSDPVPTSMITHASATNLNGVANIIYYSA